MSETIPTAAVLLIGDEILSGRTKDANLGWIADWLTALGIDLKEARVVSDDEADIVAALNALRARYSYVFTTGGIGPTHDDITADAVARAFGVEIGHHPEAVAILREHFAARGLPETEARMRMARIPDGAELIPNAVSKAPGFHIGNVFVMAGVPKIMHSMMEAITPKLTGGRKMLSRTVPLNLGEGDVAQRLKEIQQAHEGVMIGSYPFEKPDGRYGTNIVVRSRDEDRMNAAADEVEKIPAEINASPPDEAWS
ncbi:MAG: competence/damage-inducible protein A [Anderseniella sp.]|jgi:molybdenum cofactor synthesis domain-containing protein|nr:competence/damage-inducible protein A [Anderseniella sp.]